MREVLVRKAVAEDVAGVLALAGGTEGLPRWSAPAVEAMVRPEEGPVRRVLLVAEWGGVLVGFGVGSVLRAGEVEGEIEMVAVATDRRRSGVGTALVAALLGWVDGLGAGPVRLEVRVSNEGARALYERSGFVVCGRRLRYYHAPEEDALLMKKEGGP